MEAAGADIIDLGGESTRPGAAPVEADEELRRVLPVLKALARRLKAPISIDTYKAVVANAAVAEGASIVNDISGFNYDAAMAATVAETRAAFVLMHTRGRSADMYALADYDDVERRWRRSCAPGSMSPCRRAFHWTASSSTPESGLPNVPTHSYGVLARIAELSAALDRPVLVGPSRKSFMREALDDRPPAERDWGTAAAVTAAVLGGAHIVRVHAVTRDGAGRPRRRGDSARTHRQRTYSIVNEPGSTRCSGDRRSAGGTSPTSSWCRS